MEDGKKKAFFTIREKSGRKVWKRHLHRSSEKEGKAGEVDYGNLSMDSGQLFLSVAEAVGLCGAAAFLFYRSAWALGISVLFVPVFVRRKKKHYGENRRKKLERQFQSGMTIVSGSLAAGYSLENAWKAAERDLDHLYGPNADFCLEMKTMNQRIRMNESVEILLYDFACRSGSEDICQFAEIFRYAKRSGGNMNEIIRNTVDRMQEKTDILADIENLVAAKKMEQKLMNLMFPGIVLFVTLTSPEYVSVLYHNLPGILIMTGCLGGYLVSVLWSEKLMDIPI